MTKYGHLFSDWSGPNPVQPVSDQSPCFMTKCGQLFLIRQFLLYKRFGFGSIFHSIMEQPEETMETPLGDGYTIYTCGAEGTDSVAEIRARELGINVVLKIPPGHSRSKSVTLLSELQFSQADEFVKCAAQVLGSCTAFTNTYKANLLRRNLYILSRAKVLYAFGQFEDSHNPCTLKGGTGWTVQLIMEMCKKPAEFDRIPPIIFAYDMCHKAWFQLVKPTEQQKQTVIPPLFAHGFMVNLCGTK